MGGSKVNSDSESATVARCSAVLEGDPAGALGYKHSRGVDERPCATSGTTGLAFVAIPGAVRAPALPVFFRRSLPARTSERFSGPSSASERAGVKPPAPASHAWAVAVGPRTGQRRGALSSRGVAWSSPSFLGSRA
eukprot:CAMPEP_0118998170 /NCGR_PEP_ID=MMETSP1173-20130426/62934_1 /TAXON_ID=1034831 /ORGANISM="Rhizochromulina marina cf, Strain CCMP1243" /LENGTH=135 /DNA_ID=CAMNT_0006949651 /DNA_START=523 /DNA_END=927 /DNA_ORIENTATION=-